MKKIISLIAFSMVLIMLLTSCTGAKQLNDRLIIQGIGIDYFNKEYVVSVMYMDTSTSAEQKTKTLVTKGNSVVDALTNSISITGKEPLYSQNLFILLGESTVRLGFCKPLNFFAQYYESRQNVNIFVTDEKAEDIITKKGVTPQRIEDISNSKQRSGRTISSTLMQIENDRLGDYSYPKTTNITIEKDAIIANGTAVFKGDKYQFLLNTEESLAVLLISDKADTASELTMDDEENDFTLSKCESKVSINVDEKDQKLSFSIEINGNADVYELHLDREDLKKSIEKRVEEICKNSIKTCIKINRADVFGFSKMLMKQNNEYYKNAQNIGDELYKANYNVLCNMELN